jgi:hypothetical protein
VIPHHSMEQPSAHSFDLADSGKDVHPARAERGRLRHRSSACLPSALMRRRSGPTRRTVLTATDVQDRLQARHSAHYLDLYNVMKGVTLAAAGLSLLEITIGHPSAGRLLIWVVAFVGAVLSYYGASAGAALLNWRPELPDILFPMLLSVAELMLIYRPGIDVGPSGEWIPTDWFAILAAWSALCSLVIWHVSRSLLGGIQSDTYQPPLRDIIINYRAALKEDCLGAFGVALLSLGAFVALRLDPKVGGDHLLKGAVACVVLAALVRGLYSQRRASGAINAGLPTPGKLPG